MRNKSRISRSRREALYFEERRASREYFAAGLRRAGRDEARHAETHRRYLEKHRY